MSAPEKRYLGDAVYARFDRGMIALTVEYGSARGAEIFLQPETLRQLIAFAGLEVVERKEGAA